MRVRLTCAVPQSQGVFVYWITSNTFSFFQALGAALYGQHCSTAAASG